MSHTHQVRIAGAVLVLSATFLFGMRPPTQFALPETIGGDGQSTAIGATAAPPRNGACCLPNGTCITTDSRRCQRQGGVYQGNGSSCLSNPCRPPLGACCVYDANGIPTCSLQTASDCATLNGTYQGDNTNCLSNPCPIVAILGACCLDAPNGNATCYETSRQDCEGQGGTYVGDGTLCVLGSCIDPTDPTGACCVGIFQASCSEVTELECNLFGGFYSGNGTTCAEVLCGIGL